MCRFQRVQFRPARRLLQCLSKVAVMTEIANRPIMESNQALQAALELSMLNLSNTTYSTASPDPPYGLFDEAPSSPLLAAKKSQNITQCVAVPSSEHVAEIVGRQGMAEQWLALHGE